MRPLIAGNWKMHGDMSWIEKPRDLDKILPADERKHLDILICPPALFIAPMAATCHEGNILLGAQNCHRAESGAHTGELSAAMVKSAGADFVIIGHSERRAGGETDEDVAAKAMAAAQQNLTPIICVGESLDTRKDGHAESVVSDQIKASVPEGLSDYVLAYEPIWAIGTGMTATADDIQAMHAVIREIVGPKVRILYGGSVKPANAKEILGTENVNGALIGGASLEMESLAAIARAL